MWVWGIFVKSQLDKLIGLIYLQREGRVNRGFWLAKVHWGKGIMAEALTPIMEYAFDTLNFDKMILANSLGNTRSRRLKEKSGAIFIRTEKIEPRRFVNPEYKEREVWELTKERWKTFKDASPIG